MRSFSCIFIATTLQLGLGGCTQNASPSQPLFGAYFPYWLVCAAVGILGGVFLKAIFVRVGLDELLPWRLAVYGALTALIGFAFALSVYGR
ncbi:YtcA family lipoprotein [Ancylobacter terrae]|uniref:YtcA family lipoprotein n=1 Tax=Ancylobacter sp. sgz301288 TaxID=3342077 RepID=UPI00385CA35C